MIRNFVLFFSLVGFFGVSLSFAVNEDKIGSDTPLCYITSGGYAICD